MRFPRRSNGPHGGTRREPLGQGERGRGQILGQFGIEAAIESGGTKDRSHVCASSRAVSIEITA